VVVVVSASVVMAGVMVSACGGTGPSEITVSDAFLGETEQGAAAALYLTIEQSGGADRLVAVTTDVSDIVGVMPATMDMSEALTDRSVDQPIGGDTTVRYSPGGEHLMVIAVSRTLVAGDRIAVTLEFEDHEPVTVQAETLSLLDINERAADQREDEQGAGAPGGSNR
jgi:copper(I)-binding protein